MENSDCKRYTIPSGLIPTRVTWSRPGMWSIPNTSCARKNLIPLPKRLSEGKAAPSSQTVRKRPARIAESSPGISPVLRAFVTNLGGRGRDGLTMAAWQAKDGGWRHHQGPQGWYLSGTQFRELSRGERTKVETIEWRLKTLLQCFQISP